jgi:hypothetical protein
VQQANFMADTVVSTRACTLSCGEIEWMIRKQPELMRNNELAGDRTSLLRTIRAVPLCPHLREDWLQTHQQPRDPSHWMQNSSVIMLVMGSLPYLGTCNFLLFMQFVRALLFSILPFCLLLPIHTTAALCNSSHF